MNVCVECIGEEELQSWIRDNGETGECSFCSGTKSETVSLRDLATFIRERWEEFYYLAQEAPVVYSSADGGYQAPTYDPWDLLYDSHPIELPNDSNDKLSNALLAACGEDQWIDRNMGRSPHEDRLFDWAAFSQTVKHRRRFFFHSVRREGSFDWFDTSFAAFLKDLAKLCNDLGIVSVLQPGHKLYRARSRDTAAEEHTTAVALGSPPAILARQANRMNPPGISMFYAADNRDLAIAETAGRYQSVGTFTAEKRLFILDLANLPARKGIYSTVSRWEVNAIAFLHDFADLIRTPVARDQSEHIEYVPTQVFTEYLRDYPMFETTVLDGVRYRSATGVAGTNIVLFATQNDVVDGAADKEAAPTDETPAERWLRLVSVEQIERIEP